MKSLGVNLTKPIQDHNAKNYKILVIGITEKLNKWEDMMSWSYTGRLNRAKILILPKLIFLFNAIPTKVSAEFIF